MTWPSKRGKRKFLDSDLDRVGESIPGISEWLLEHYVCILPSPSNCVRTPGVYHRDKVERLTALVNDTGERPGLWLLGVVLQVALIRGMAEEPPENGWATSWHEVFTLFRRGRWSSRSPGDVPGWCYMTKCQINYARNLEYDQCVRARHRHLGDPEDIQTAVFPRENNPFDPRPYAPVYATVVKHNKAMWDLDPYLLREPEEPEPGPETPRARTLYHSVTYAAAMRQLVDGLRSRFDDMEFLESNEREEGLKHRMLRYPVEGWIDGSVTVAIPDFLSALADDIGEARIAHRFLLFKKWEDVPGLNSNSTRSVDILHLPVLLISHQNAEYTTLSNATKNTQRLACVSAATFLAVLGIKDIPVYGLATYGYTGVVSQACFSEEDNCCYSMDGVTPRYRFNLCREEGILRLLNFLDKLDEHARELRRRWDQVLPQLLERARTANEGRAALSWTFHSQLTEHDLWEHAQVPDDRSGFLDVDSASDHDLSDSDYWSDFPNSEGFLHWDD